MSGTMEVEADPDDDDDFLANVMERYNHRGGRPTYSKTEDDNAHTLSTSDPVPIVKQDWGGGMEDYEVPPTPPSYSEILSTSQGERARGQE